MSQLQSRKPNVMKSLKPPLRLRQRRLALEVMSGTRDPSPLGSTTSPEKTSTAAIARVRAVSLLRCRRYWQALESISPEQRPWMFVQMLAEVTRKGCSPTELGAEYTYTLVFLVSSCKLSFTVPKLVEHYFPNFVKAFWETFFERGRGVLNRSKFLKAAVTAIKQRLMSELDGIHTGTSRNNFTKVKKRRKVFGKLVLSAAKFLQSDVKSGSQEGSSLDLFSEAVTRGLLSEAVLLYDSGHTSPRELTALSLNTQVKTMVTGDHLTPMAAFLRQVLTRPPSLKSRCRGLVSGLLGDGHKGKLDRGRSVGLPTSVSESLVGLHQAKVYLRSAVEDHEHSVRESGEFASMDIELDSELQALTGLLQ